ncbi:MAG TPA: hypothetical protein PK678_09375, partial [Ferruginibacter sp.]|nr:hypothetical protein [Ferruginibacter sp.]
MKQFLTLLLSCILVLCGYAQPTADTGAVDVSRITGDSSLFSSCFIYVDKTASLSPAELMRQT